MVSLFNLAGVGACGLGLVLMLMLRLEAGLLGIVAGAVFLVGGALVDELRRRLPLPERDAAKSSIPYRQSAAK